eukprot:TRINITY_DN40199_c0_g1_i1.p1 TRINITY_DN40199_c0_g1~~TRINITY_DN40199_c0_g1_i1.p1  ORF type:complete len:673 (-),score=109.49 TRINITY_DN40199_c0_g1_i1:470-2311(-)
MPQQQTDGSTGARATVSSVFLRLRSLSYTAVFALGFVCSLLFGFMRPESRIGTTGAVIAKAYEEMLTSDTVEGWMSGTTKLRQLLDQRLLRHASAVTSSFTNVSLSVRDIFGGLGVGRQGNHSDTDRVGVRLARTGVTVNNPVVLVPGIITTGLEVWDGEDCMKSYFRQRIWGTTSMLQSILSDPECWLRHLALNATTGLDPMQSPHLNRSIRVRPAQGFESGDFFLGGYWLWGQVIEALADIGYDINTMYMASYDWRLSYADLQKRDWYFTKLKQQIETLVTMNGKKAVVVAHSMGGNLWHYFMQWVTHHGPKMWVGEYIHAEVFISTPMLGLPKAFYSLLTGDNRDFASMGQGLSTIINHFFGPSKRRDLWRTCSSLALIMPIGGEETWGDRLAGMPLVRLGDRNLTVEEARNLLAAEGNVPEELQRISPWLLDGMRRNHPAKTINTTAAAVEPPEHVWANALATALPFAPQLKKYAFYGVGVDTEFSGVFQKSGDQDYAIDKSATKDVGFYLGNGDYSVPVSSLGLMCLKGWKSESRNPSNISCTVREYRDEPTTLLSSGYIRGGKASGDHIDILGNDEMLTDLITVVTGGEVQERIVSELPSLAEKWHI